MSRKCLHVLKRKPPSNHILLVHLECGGPWTHVARFLCNTKKSLTGLKDRFWEEEVLTKRRLVVGPIFEKMEVATLNMIFNVTMVTFWMTLFMNKWTNIVVDDGWNHVVTKILLSATCDEILSWMIGIWMKNHLVSDNNCSSVYL